MKRFGVAILLATLGLTTACPQAGQVLSPATFSAGNSKTSDKNVDDEDTSHVEDTFHTEEASPIVPKSDPADVEDPQVIAAKKMEPPSDKGYGTIQDDIVTGDRGQTVVMGKDPIQPKADDYTVDDAIWTFAAARLRYGPNFDKILDPAAVTPPKLTLPPNGAISFPAFAEVDVDGNPLTPWVDSKGYSVRMVYRPDANPSKPIYCDAQVFEDYVKEEGGNVLFSGVAAGKGRLTFYHLIPLADLIQKGTINSDHFSSCISGGWKPLLRSAFLADEWTDLGSLKTEPLILQFKPGSQGPLIPTKPVLPPLP